MKLLILSDIHGNWPALEAVLQAERTWDAVAFCGDVVDYGPWPVECIRWLARNARFAVRGNHDNALAFGKDCRCMGSFREASLATRGWHRTLLGEDELAYLRKLPALEFFEWDGRFFRMAHATPHGDLYEYVAPENWSDHVRGLADDFILVGHTHVQGRRQLELTTVVNPGSVGLERDRGGEACYAVCEDGRIRLERVAYDTERTIAGLWESPLSVKVIESLAAVLRGRKSTATAGLHDEA